MMPAPLEHLVPVPGPLPLAQTLQIPRYVLGDPTQRRDAVGVLKATWTAEGAATVRFVAEREGIRVTAWGAGAGAAVGEAPAWLGLHDDPSGFEPREAVLRELWRRFAGLRIGRTGRVWEALAPHVVAQKVSGADAARSWQDLVRRYGEPAPGPERLRMPPRPERIAALGYAELHLCGLEQRRASTLIRAAREMPRLEAAMRQRPEQAQRRLEALRGIGLWTVAKVVGEARGDADVVPLGDYNLPSVVAWALAGERRATDARMLELLEPYRGHRARVVRLLEAGHVSPPRRGPRREILDFRRR